MATSAPAEGHSGGGRAPGQRHDRIFGVCDKLDLGPLTLGVVGSSGPSFPCMSRDERGVQFEELNPSQCRVLLQTASVGRLSLSIEALPVVLPVNYAVDGDAVVFRTMPGTKLSAALFQTVVAFEVDDYEPNGDVGWSVLVRGISSEIQDDDAVTRARNLPLRFISPGGLSDSFIRIPIGAVTGRSLQPRYQVPA